MVELVKEKLYRSVFYKQIFFFNLINKVVVNKNRMAETFIINHSSQFIIKQQNIIAQISV